MKNNKITKNVVFLSIIILVGANFLPSTLGAEKPVEKPIQCMKNIIVVDDEGDGDYLDIQTAIDNASNKDTIWVYSGFYQHTSTLIVDNEINLIGISEEFGEGDDDGKPIIYLNSSYQITKVRGNGVTIDGFNFQGRMVTAGLMMDGNLNCTIINNDFSGPFWTGILMMCAGYNMVYNNKFMDLFVGIDAGYRSCYNIIENNIFLDCEYGIGDYGGMNHNIISNNTISYSPIEGEQGLYGIWVGDIYGFGEYNIVTNNDISNYEYGIVVRNAKFNLISNNTLTNNYCGIICVDSSKNNFKNNYISQNSNGIKINAIARNNNVTNNTIINNVECGIGLSGVYLEQYYFPVKGTIIKNNIIENNGWGIYLNDTIENEISNNNINYNSAAGIKISNSSNNTIYNNSIANNKYGINITGIKSFFNQVYLNDFVNQFNAYDSSKNIYYNLFKGIGNFWDDYQGEDNNGDGIGDTPYNISGGDNMDNYPLMEPLWGIYETVCGDANMDGIVDVGDIVFIINYVFRGGSEPIPYCRGDANGDADVNAADAVYIVSYIFKGGNPPLENCCN